MSKYIRTNDRIVKSEDYHFLQKYNRYVPDNILPGLSDFYSFTEDEILGQSDNPEDLFDAYVTYDIHNGYDFFTGKNWDDTYPFEEDLKRLKGDTLWVMNNRPDLKSALYGAIWTDKGLIFVAKMNKDGEWELI